VQSKGIKPDQSQPNPRRTTQMPMKNRNVWPATAALTSTLLFVVAQGAETRSSESRAGQWRIAGQTLSKPWSRPAEHSIRPRNFKGLSPEWVFRASGDVSATPAVAAETALIEPHSLIVDRSLPRVQVDIQIIAARRYATFWNTGDEALARAALAPNFIDNTLPPGRPQGLTGPLAASKVIRTAIPDMGCDLEQMIVAGDRVVAYLRFHGYFTGRFKQIQGQGQTINFIATDIYRIADGRIAENWHIEDNLSLQQQLGLIVE
jgi:predicted ester cyclase